VDLNVVIVPQNGGVWGGCFGAGQKSALWSNSQLLAGEFSASERRGWDHDALALALEVQPEAIEDATLGPGLRFALAE